MEKKQKIIIFFGFIALLTLCFVIVHNNQAPAVYVEQQTEATEATTEAKYDTVNYMDEDNSFCVDVVSDWTKINSGGDIQFIHAPSKSSLTIHTETYDPMINMQNADSVCPENSTMVSFRMYDNNKYLYQYQEETEDGMYDVTVYQMWDFDRIVTMTFSIKDEYYDVMSPKISYMIDSVYFKLTNEIPVGFQIYYDSIRNYAFGYKPVWESQTADNGFRFIESESRYMTTIEWYQTAEDTSMVTQMDYTSFASKGRSGFCLESYQNTGQAITATATYNDGNGTNYVMEQYIICTGIYEYMVTVDARSDMMQEASEDINIFLQLFTIYPGTQAPDNGQEPEEEEESREYSNEELDGLLNALENTTVAETD